MIGRATGAAFAAARDFLARGLVRAGVSPNALTLIGMALTAAAGVGYALGAESPFAWSLRAGAANAYLLAAGVLLLGSSACDMLDGAVARLADRKSDFGAFLDSTLDRYSDFAVFAGIAAFYAWRGNLTFVLLCMLALFNSFMISYTRARAEDIIRFCTVGYWQRGERSVAILIATFAHTIPALVLQQALLPLLTVARRIAFTRAVINGRKPVLDPRDGTLWDKLRPWRWPRMTIPYDLVTIVNILYLLLARFRGRDWLRDWLA